MIKSLLLAASPLGGALCMAAGTHKITGDTTVPISMIIGGMGLTLAVGVKIGIYHQKNKQMEERIAKLEAEAAKGE